jgi:hypothetical protein
MASKKLKWGKMKVEIAPIASTGTIGTYAEVFTPVQGSFALNVEEGDKLEAFIEGGERIAVRSSANKYSFEFQVYITDALPKPIADVDGVITDEYAIRVVPENSSLTGFLMERAAVSVTETFTSGEGHRATYAFEALKPETGAMLKPYLPLEVTPKALSFTSAADNTGKTITATASGTVTAVSGQSWATVTVSGNAATVKVAANSGAARTANITLSADGKQAVVTVTQAGV